MKGSANPQHGVINHLVAIRMHGYGFGHDRLDLVRHHAELSAMAPSIAVFGFVVEEVEADAKRMLADTNDIFFDASIRSARSLLILRALVWFAILLT